MTAARHRILEKTRGALMKTTTDDILTASANVATGVTTDGQVAQQIVMRLLTEGLIDETQADSILLGLTEGAMRESDWRFLAENAIAMEERHAANTH